MTLLLARPIAVKSRLPSKESSIINPKGQVISVSSWLLSRNGTMFSTVSRDATSPAFWPPRPSQTATTPISGRIDEGVLVQAPYAAGVREAENLQHPCSFDPQAPINRRNRAAMAGPLPASSCLKKTKARSQA